MCEYCHWTTGHHPRCPNAPEPEILGQCEQCGEDLVDGYEYYSDNEDNTFCSEECALIYHGVKSKEWNYEKE